MVNISEKLSYAFGMNSSTLTLKKSIEKKDDGEIIVAVS
jgi:hypothetical protein